jgi:hypothetical protein
MSRRTKRDLLESIHGDAVVSSAKLWNRTGLEFDMTDGSHGWQLHDTLIARKYPNGRLWLNSGGWRTVTTKERINRILDNGYRLWQERGVWYLSQSWDGPKVVFYDGIIIDPTDGPVARPEEESKVRDVIKRIDKFMRHARKVFASDGVPTPSAGDCFFCQCKSPSKDCIESHVDECCLHGSLIYNALKRRRRDEQIGFIWNMSDIVSRELRSFLKAQLGVGQ